MPAVAFVGFDTNRIVQFVMNVLAVGGGFLIGYVVTGLVAWLLDRWLTGGKSPQGVHRVARILGGLVVAILVALMLFGRGGPGTGEGAGGGPTNEKGEGHGTGTQQTRPTNTDTTPPPPQTDSTPPEQRVRVTLLGGEDVKDEKFYQIGDDRTPRTLKEVAEAVDAKKAATGKPVGIEIRFAANNTLPPDHPAVLRLENWARANGVTVSLPPAKP